MKFDEQLKEISQKIYDKVLKYIEENQGNDYLLYNCACITIGKKQLIYNYHNGDLYYTKRRDRKLFGSTIEIKEDGNTKFNIDDYEYDTSLNEKNLENDGCLDEYFERDLEAQQNYSEEKKQFILYSYKELYDSLDTMNYNYKKTRDIDNLSFEAFDYFSYYMHKLELSKLDTYPDKVLPTVKLAVDWWTKLYFGEQEEYSDKVNTFRENLTKTLMDEIIEYDGEVIQMYCDYGMPKEVYDALNAAEIPISIFDFHKSKDMFLRSYYLSIRDGYGQKAKTLYDSSANKKIFNKIINDYLNEYNKQESENRKMTNYLDTLDPLIKDYYKVLSEDFPEFLIEYIETPRMQKQDKISCSCGECYTKMNYNTIWYSSLAHSIAVALIIWHFTHDKVQTLSGLFHDISTPPFKHCIDFMNGDHENQESTEDLTRKMIEGSPEIMDLLKRDGITVDEVADYHMYPIADNDTPMLSADRLEYTLSNGLGACKEVMTLDEVKKIYDDIIVIEKEDGTPEMCFKEQEIAEKFVEKMSELSILYMRDQRRFSMQFLADIMKRMSEAGLITIDDLYELSEEEVINKIQNCEDYNIANCFKMWQEADDVKISDTPVEDKYCINVKAKKRYINPLVLTESGAHRIADISDKAKANIDKCLNYSFDRYIYMDFNFTNVKKLNKALEQE